MTRVVGIVVHPEKEEAKTVALEVIAWLRDFRSGTEPIDVMLDAQSALRLNLPENACPPDGWVGVEFIISLGGDGTILTAARSAAAAGIPILGVHMGRFGFIAETHPGDLYPHLEQILEGDMRLEERIMVRADIYRDSNCVSSQTGLNDALVKSRASQLLHIRTRLAFAEFATYPADGIIVSTPTGSTAYSLSAGGPLVSPTVNALVITPICPHTLSARPMVVPAEETVEIEIETESGDVVCVVDGVQPFPILNGDKIVIQRAQCVTRLIVLDHATFYRKVRDRYLYGERLND